MATQPNRKNPKQKKPLPIAAMATSFAVGVFVMFLIDLKENPKTPSKGSTGSEVTSRPEKKVIEPTFDFYTVLPEMEVVVEKPKAPSRPTVIQDKKALAAVEIKEKIHYIVQVASFKNPKDADSFKAKLALLGIESKVKAVAIGKEKTWHRVQIGPVLGQEKAEKLKAKLKTHGIESLTMRAKNS